MKNLFLILSLSISFSVMSETEFATIEQRVISSLNITKRSDMVFPVAVAGDGGYTIIPTSSETSENASFLISGEPNMAFRVILPGDNQVKLRSVKQLDGGRFISVNGFDSNLKTSSGRLDRRGEFLLFVGASREAIPRTLPSGLYRGTFSVTVVY